MSLTPDDLSGCPYYQSGGTCTYGCWSEPACITDRPQGGWPSERDDPDGLPGDYGPAFPEPECWGETSYEHHKGECRHYQGAS